ncbi:hypothetical protein [Desulfosporosinus nitroreducens]|nr:hypothetical protein [Desulfosporosinus nitroreducens]
MRLRKAGERIVFIMKTIKDLKHVLIFLGLSASLLVGISLLP